MKRITLTVVVAACGILTAGQTLFAQEPNPAANWFAGKATMTLLGRGDVESSRFEEYREYPKGVSMPTFDLAGSQDGVRYALFGESISQRDQRYRGSLTYKSIGISADYNAIMHNIGFGGQSIVTETAPGVWSLSKTLRTSLQNTYDTTASAVRIYPWLLDLYGPTLAATNLVDVSLQRNRGTYLLDLGKGHPVGLTLSYMRETRRGAKDTTPIYVSSQTIELPTPTDFITQDVGLSTALDRPWGNVHAAYNYNWFNDRLTLLTVDNPLRDSDAPYVNSIGGPAKGINVLPPDNSATSLSAGAQLKFAKQTRVMADYALSQFRQDAAFTPYTLNTAVFTTSGAPAWDVASLPAKSLNGKIDTTTINVGLTSRPVDPLYVNLKFRDYNFDNKTPIIVAPGYVGWDRAWTAGPQGNLPYGYQTRRLDGIIGYDVAKTMTLEAAYRHVTDDRTFREAETVTENGMSITAIMRQAKWAMVRATFDTASRTASNLEPGATNLHFDLANRDSKKAGVDLEMSPTDALTFMLSYAYRKDTYKGQAFGYQSAEYNVFSGDVNVAAKDRATFDFYYTYEVNKDGHKGYQVISTVNEWYTAMANDKTNSVGTVATFHLVPDKWTLTLDGNYQKVNGLMAFDGSPAVQATRAGNGGIKDIPNHDDTTLTTLRAQLTRALGPKWDWTMGAWYRDYKFDDSGNTAILSYPQSNFPMVGLFTLSPNYHSYHVAVGFTSLTYRF